MEESRRPFEGEARLAGSELRRHELSVVACDLRGFTAFLEAAGPEHVIDLLRDYYAVVADEVLRFGGTIKDHAGDGMLALVGSERPEADHARRAVEMALSIAARAGTALCHWQRAGIEVGLGVGVASGNVTVGKIEAASRLESVAVGTAVNLAARLCSRAGHGQILVAERTVELIGRDHRNGFHFLEAVQLKGFSGVVPVFEARGP